jgi:two-component system sensor histidine kinase VicK
MTASLRSLTGDLRAAAETEGALRERLETVIAAMTDGVVAADTAGLVTTVNTEAARLLGVPAAEIVGRPLLEVVDVRRTDGSGLLPVDRIDADGELFRTDGSTVPVRLAVAPLAGDGGSVVTIGDRSREREVERLKTEFLSNVSHELRTPLTPIKGYAEILTRRADLEPAQVGRFAGEILSSTERMTRVVALLVDVAALDAGRVVPRRAPVEVGTLLDAALTGWRARWPDRAADLRRSVARDLPPVDVDAEWVTKALAELADNAVKLTTAGSRITVRAEPAGERVRVKLVDAGPGIEAERLPDLLGDFSQVDASATRHVEGLGLGLGFVRRVCEQFDLGLHVSSTPGRGSEFGLDLPVATAPPAGGTRQRRRRLPGRGGDAPEGTRRRTGARLRSRATAR